MSWYRDGVDNFTASAYVTGHDFLRDSGDLVARLGTVGCPEPGAAPFGERGPRHLRLPGEL